MAIISGPNQVAIEPLTPDVRRECPARWRASMPLPHRGQHDRGFSRNWLVFAPEESHTKNSQAASRPRRSEVVFSMTSPLISPPRVFVDSSLLLQPSDIGSDLRHFCISHMRQSRHVAKIPV
jgi:hypothetical protein